MVRPKRGEPGHEEAVIKTRETMVKKLGGEEAAREFYRRIGRKGGQFCGAKGFALNPEKARLAGAKGGRKSRRPISGVMKKLNENKSEIISMLQDGSNRAEIAKQLGVSYSSFYNWSKKNIKEEVLYGDKVG